MTRGGEHARDQVFESPDGTTLTLHQIAYYGWKEGGYVEQDGDVFLVDGTRYMRIDNEGDS